MAEYLHKVNDRDMELYNRLQRQRDQLLVDVNRIPGERLSFQRIKEQKFEYNKLTKTLLTLEKSPLGDPLLMLPPELWLQIFIHGLGLGKTETFFEMRDARNCVDRVLSATLVSTRWRDTLVATPKLWTMICIGLHTEEDKKEKILTSLALSGSSRLHLYLDLNSPEWLEHSPLLAPHSSRIGSITICKYPIAQIRITESDISTLFSALGPLPSLTELHVTPEVPFIENDVFETIISRAPSLHELRGVWIYDSDSFDPRSLRFETLSISASSEKVIPILQVQTSLRRLYVQSMGSSDGEDCASEDTAGRLETLMAIFRSEMAAPKFLDYISRASRLSYMHIVLTESWASLPSLIDMLEKLPKLLHLNIDIQQMSQAPIPSIRRSNPISIRHLCIVSDGEYMHVLDALTGSTPWLISLILEVEENAVYPAQFISALSRLEFMHIYFYHGVEMHSVDVQGLLHLGLSISSPDSTKVSKPVTLCSPDLRALRLLNGPQSSVDDGTSFSSLLDIDLALQLTDLDCSKVPVFFDIVTLHKLSSLRKLECTENALYTNSLLYSLIMQPVVLPQLEHISLSTRSVPWDLLLLFLERRNTLSSTLGVNHIKHVVVFGRPPLPVARLIVQSLRREFIFLEPQSYKKFSMEVIWKRYMDTNVTGCQSCALALKECDIESIILHHPLSMTLRMSAAPFPFEADAAAWPVVIPEPPIDDSVMGWLEQRAITAQQLRTTWSTWGKKYCRKLYDDHQPRQLYFGFSPERPIDYYTDCYTASQAYGHE